jgi:hypothetical protein
VVNERPARPAGEDAGPVPGPPVTMRSVRIPPMTFLLLLAGVLVSTACTAGGQTADTGPTAPLPPPPAATRAAAPTTRAVPLDFDAIRERPCDLLRAEKAAELGWFVPGYDTSGAAGQGKLCTWVGPASLADGVASAIAPFDLATFRSRTGAEDIRVAGRAALRYLRGDTATVAVDLGAGRALVVFTRTARGESATDSTAAEALAAALLENVRT